METVRVRFEPEGVEVDVRDGATIHEAAAEAGILLEAPCGGLGRCGSCRVHASGGLRPPGATELEALSGADLAAGTRLSCLARIGGPATVMVRHATVRPLRVEASGPRAAKASPREGLGIAVDLGTTTVAVSLYDLADGRLLDTASALNPQVAFGHDVMTRVSRSVAGDADALRDAVTGQLDRMVRELLVSGDDGCSDLSEIVVVGNPAMVHLLLGRDVAPFAAAPHEGALIDAFTLPASDAGLPGAPDATVYIGAAISAFVGSDAVAGVLATGLAQRTDPTLLIDLGTNGEIVLRANGATTATSAAAGPAMEGVSISSGMRAEPGAIDRVRLVDGRIEVTTVDGEPARGICGSGLLDAVASLLDAGAIDASGRISESYDLAPDVLLTQQDVRALQLAKGAVAVAIDVLLEEAGVAADDVREVIVAGAFGSHVSPRSLVRLGILPQAWAGRVTFAGNTALAGATAMLLDPAARARASALARETSTVKLATHPEFQRRFLAALDFPPAAPDERDR
ncbi:MAG: ASKHA domain-containing protein [Coriobacteriia bacterium]|nr:ASKHA domain-containing protein [Coriobacteriia bacterium]